MRINGNGQLVNVLTATTLAVRNVCIKVSNTNQVETLPSYNIKKYPALLELKFFHGLVKEQRV
jgi:hypothetical protein